MEQNIDTIRLTAKRKRNFWNLIFSRAGLLVVLVAMQIIVFMGIYRWFEDYFKWLSAVQGVFSVVMILYLFNSGMDSAAKLTWLIFIMLFPVPGVLLLAFTRWDLGHRKIKARVEKLIEETKQELWQDRTTVEKKELIDSGTDDLCRYVNRSGCFPIYERTKVTYFPSGEEKYEALLRELEKAEKFIFLEYFIIEEGLMWGSVLKILADKAEQGVDVRLIYDGMCEVVSLPGDYTARLARLGIAAKAFSPIKPFISTHYNYRDHRKIVVIDGKTAFNGGVNLADEYINHRTRFGHWKDAAVMVKGEAVRSYTLMFLQMWNITEEKPEWHQCLEPILPVRSDGFVMPYADCPLDDDKVGESVYMDILNRARSYVHIMTPYLILDGELETSLKFAAERGVDVKLILPGVPDKIAAYSLAKSHYKVLIAAGVKIYEYKPGFVHSKVFVSDDEKAVVGTINLDYRSLYHHFECATYLYKTSCIDSIEKDFQNTLSQCREVTDETIQNEKLIYRVLGGFMKTVAPLM